MTNAMLTLDPGYVFYTGEVQKPEATVQMLPDKTVLQEGLDYELSYCTINGAFDDPNARTYLDDPWDAGHYYVFARGKGNYSGESHWADYSISSVNSDNAVVSITGIVDKLYTGSAITQTPKVVVNGRTLVRDKEYYITYKNNVEVGTATCYIKSKCQAYRGCFGDGITFQIKSVSSTSLAKATVTAPNQTWTGAALKPSPKVALNGKTLKNGTDYTVSYRNNVKPGTATVTVTGKGKYTGTAKGTFTIKQLATPSVQAVQNVVGGVKVTIKKPAGAKACRIYCKVGTGDWKRVADTASTSVVVKSYNGKSLQTGTSYRFTVCCIDKVGGTIAVSGRSETGRVIAYVAAPTLSSVKNPTAQTATAAWGKVAGVTGFQIQYSTSKTFASGNKTVTVKKAAATAQAITGLTKGKTYYFRIRSYKTISGKVLYSAWSAVKGLKMSR